MIRPTTNGVLKTYRYHLFRNTNTLNRARETVLTGKHFNSFAEDPAAVARSFQVRTSLLRLDSQKNANQVASRKFDVAWSSVSQAVGYSDEAKECILRASSSPTGSGLNALGQQLSQLAQSMVKSMNVKYGDNYVFAGADGLNVPMELKGTTLTYRGINVDSMDPSLDYFVQQEHKYTDIGLGLEEDQNNQMINSSAFDTALHSITFLGYGVDDDGDPKNIASLMARMGQLLQNCDADGNFKDGEKEIFDRLATKFDESAARLSNKHTELDTRAAFLKNNEKHLDDTNFAFQEEIAAIENVDPAEAITSFSWAQYCYNSALKVGNSILSQSLMDYLNH